MTISIRQMTADDVPAAQALLAQLGYDLDMREVARRHAAVASSTDHTVTVAERSGRVVALCHAFVRPALDKPPEVIVQALVVDQAIRGGGIGKLVMAAVEAWAANRGFASVALSSNVVRADAHAFYGAIGYRQTATSHLFRKMLG